MLKTLHVKNLALVREVEITFGEGLNILSGETGAGKSVLIESIAAALGGRIAKDLVRKDADYALAELEFEVRRPSALKALREMDIPVLEDGTVLVSRRITEGRNTIRVNDETFTAGRLKAAAPFLLDIYGQNEHHTLQDTGRQMALLDEYGKKTIAPLKEKTAAFFRARQEAAKKLASLSLGEEERIRTIDLITYEVNEIEEAALRPGEDEELEAEYRRLANGQKIIEALQTAYSLTGYGMQGAGDLVGNAVRSLAQIRGLDADLAQLSDQIADIDGLLNDFNRDLSDYLDSFSYDEESLHETEVRLNQINRLKTKYGGSIEAVQKALEDRKRQLDVLTHYEEEKEAASAEYGRAAAQLDKAAGQLRAERLRTAEVFARETAKQLRELNFAQVDFAIELPEKAESGENGRDSIEFMISTNPGEERRPLRKVASGGELSRIMLGIKTMFAGQEEADTMIFDEIDTGISGRTAQRVAEKLASVSSERQVLCITHLPQIASMADHHFLIEKEVEGNTTRTVIRELSEEGSVTELARMIGGAEVTEQTQRSAAEMKQLSVLYRKGRKEKL